MVPFEVHYLILRRFRSVVKLCLAKTFMPFSRDAPDSYGGACHSGRIHHRFDASNVCSTIQTSGRLSPDDGLPAEAAGVNHRPRELVSPVCVSKRIRDTNRRVRAEVLDWLTGRGAESPAATHSNRRRCSSVRVPVHGSTFGRVGVRPDPGCSPVQTARPLCPSGTSGEPEHTTERAPGLHTGGFVVCGRGV